MRLKRVAATVPASAPLSPHWFLCTVRSASRCCEPPPYRKYNCSAAPIAFTNCGTLPQSFWRRK